MGSTATGAGEATTTGNGSATVDKGVDFANYFCTYAFLYHQKEMLSDRVRMDAYYNSVFNNKHHFIGKNQIGSSSSSSMSKKSASSCDVCRAKGFYMCKLCRGNATIEWSPLYDPVFINPCLCPTCDGHRIQRCLNCLGSGFIQQAKAYD